MDIYFKMMRFLFMLSNKHRYVKSSYLKHNKMNIIENVCGLKF